MTLFPDRLLCPIFPSESLLFDDQKDAEKLDNCDCKIWHQITAAELKKRRLAMFFGRTRLASTVHMWLPNIRECSSKQALPSFILKQYYRVPWLVPLTVYPSCLANSPGRLGPLGHKIPGFVIALLLHHQTASAQAKEKHNSLVITQHACLQWIKPLNPKWKSTAEHSYREVKSAANTHRNRGELTGQWQLEFRTKLCL